MYSPPVLQRGLCFLSVLFVLAAGAGKASAAPLELRATSPDRGWIDLSVSGTPGASVSIAEVSADGSPMPLTSFVLDGEAEVRPHLLLASCARVLRTFTATSMAPDGATESATATVRTNACRRRLAFVVSPFSPRARRPFVVRVRDQWGLGGVGARVCFDPRRGRKRCRPVTFAAGTTLRRVRLRATAAGRGRVTVETPWRAGSLGRDVDVRSRHRPLTILATGDSMIQVVDSFLKQRLGRRGVRVQSDARISTGISKPFMLDWVSLARRQARSRRPTAAVIFIGANDGFPIAGAPCCGDAWVRRYAVRVRRMIAAYRRGGASRVYWLTLPTPRKSQFARVFRGVNAALRLAQPELAGAGRLIDTGAVFAPGGRFRARWRQSDGVHLNVAGASRAAKLVIDQMRRDGLIG